MSDHIPQRPLLSGLEPRHFAHPLDVSARRRMDRLIAGKPRMGKLFASLERSLEDEEYLKNLADNTRLNENQAASLYRLVEEVAADARMPTPRVFLDTLAEGAAAGEALYRMVVPAKVVKQISEGLVNPIASKAVSGGIHGTLKGSSRIVGQATFVPVASKGATVGGGGAAVAGAGVMTVAAPLVLMAVAVGVSAYADQQRQKAIAHITELVEKLHDDQLARERSALNGCRDAIEKATSVLLDQGRIGASLGLDSAVYTISTALADAEARLTRWQQALSGFGDKPVGLPALLKAIKGIEQDEGEFHVHLQLAKAAIELKKRVIVLQAVEHAQMDESNPFESFVRTLNKDKRRILELESGMTDVLTKLSQLKLTRSKGWADRHLLTSAQADQLLSVAYRLQALGNELPSNDSTDVAIEIAQERDGSIIVFPALPA